MNKFTLTQSQIDEMKKELPSVSYEMYYATNHVPMEYTIKRSQKQSEGRRFDGALKKRRQDESVYYCSKRR